MSRPKEDPAGSGPGRKDRGGSAASKNGPGGRNNGWAGKGPKKGADPRASGGKRK